MNDGTDGGELDSRSRQDDQSVTKQTLQRRIETPRLVFVAAGWEKCSPFHSQGPESRGYYMLHFVLKGRGHLYINNQHYVITAGQCFCIPPGATAYYHSDRSNPWTYVWLDFNGEDSDRIVRKCSFSPSQAVISLGNVNIIAHYIRRMMHFSKATESMNLAALSAMLLIFSLLEGQEKHQVVNYDETDNALIKETVNYIQNHLNSALRVDDIAKSLFVSRSYLSRLFKKEMNTTLQGFIREARVQNACELLVRTKLSISDIALKCGYKNQFSFSRAFSESCEVSPTQFRKLYARPDDIISE